jgi:hypothetical protein
VARDLEEVGAVFDHLRRRKRRGRRRGVGVSLGRSAQTDESNR